MARKKYWFHRRVRIESADTGTNNLDFKNRYADREYHIMGSAVMNDTTDYDKLSWGAYDGNIFHIYEEEITPLKNVYYTFHEEVVLTEGQSYRAELTGCTADDELRMFFRGYFYKDVKVQPKPEEKEKPEGKEKKE